MNDSWGYVTFGVTFTAKPNDLTSTRQRFEDQGSVMETEERLSKRRRLSQDEPLEDETAQIESYQFSNGGTVNEAASEGAPAITLDGPSEGTKLQHPGLGAERNLNLEDTNRNDDLPPTATTQVVDSLDLNGAKLDSQSEGLPPPDSGPGVEHTSNLEDGDDDRLPPPDTTAPIADCISNNPDGQTLSKTQRKKLAKKQEWEAKREDRKVIRKEKNIAKRTRRREEWKQQHQDALINGEPPPQVPTKTKSGPRPTTLPVTFMIDCDFDDLMRDNERISLAGQITRSYSDNKAALYRAHLAVCSFQGKLRERFEKVLEHHKQWRGVRFLDCDFVEAAEQAKGWMGDEKDGGKLVGTFANLCRVQDESGELEHHAVIAELKEAGEVVYLTSESENTLTELKPYSTYIIGGLVDKNREKGICYKRAKQRGIKTARLPIGEFMEMQSRKVLATNHVNEIMLKWLECGDWGEAFLKAIPKRKGGRLKRGRLKGGKGEGDGDDEDNDDNNVHNDNDDDDAGDGDNDAANRNGEDDGSVAPAGGENENDSGRQQEADGAAALGGVEDEHGQSGHEDEAGNAA